MILASFPDVLDSWWLEVAAVTYFCVMGLVSCVIVSLKGRSRAWCILAILFPPSLLLVLRRPPHPRAGQFQCPFCGLWNPVERETCLRCGEVMEFPDFVA